MNLETPEKLRERAHALREAAFKALEAADEDAIRADVLDHLINAQPSIIEAHSRLATAEATGSVEDVTAASFDLCDAEIATWPLSDVILDPLNLVNFTGSPAWLARTKRPEIYRRVLASRADGNVVPDLAYEAAVEAARRAWKYDAELIGDVERTSGGM